MNGAIDFSSKLDFLVQCRLIDLAQHIVVDHFELIALIEELRVGVSIRYQDFYVIWGKLQVSNGQKMPGKMWGGW